MIGYRNESLYGSGIRDLESVIEFEICELNNFDIAYTLLNNWGLTNIQRRYFKTVLDLAESTLEDRHLQSLVKTCLNTILKHFPKAKYCLWLCSKNAVELNYEGNTANIDAYEIEINKPISDLGFNDQGCLYLFTKIPKPINTIKESQEQHTYRFTGKATYYNRNTGTTTQLYVKPNMTTDAVSEREALSNFMWQIKHNKRNNVPVNHPIELIDYTIERIDSHTDTEETTDSIEQRLDKLCDKCNTPLTDAGECPQCDLLDSRYNENVSKITIKEDFVSNLVPGETYYFTKANRIYKGQFKNKTPAWLVFDVDGNEVLAKPWANVATSEEDLVALNNVVDKLDKDTKVPQQIPNRFTRVPNQHGKPVGESVKPITEANNKMVYLLIIEEFDETLYAVGHTADECLQNAIKGMEYFCKKYGGYEDLDEYIEYEHEGCASYEELIYDYIGASIIKTDNFIVYGE